MGDVQLELPRLWDDVETQVMPEPGKEAALVEELLSRVETPREPERRERVTSLLAVPGWTSREERLVLAVPFVKMVLRTAAFARTEGSATLGIRLVLPEEHAYLMAPQVARVLSSARRAE